MHAGDTPYDTAISRKIPSLIRRFERCAKLGALMLVKVPALFGLGSEFKEFWVVLFQRLPAPTVPSHLRICHSQLFLFSSYADPVPVVKLWTDGAQVACVQRPATSATPTDVLVRPPSHAHAAPATP